ncbi:MAG: hypothetical protein HQL50_01370 [Magnetococcales bacterium]|nr:hypothetical protein [Magnetococcales bacterium]
MRNASPSRILLSVLITMICLWSVPKAHADEHKGIIDHMDYQTDLIVVREGDTGSESDYRSYMLDPAGSVIRNSSGYPLTSGDIGVGDLIRFESRAGVTGAEKGRTIITSIHVITAVDRPAIPKQD